MKTNAEKVANWFICKDPFQWVSNLEIQKLLYFASKDFLKKHNELLFEEKFEAWKYGPVIPEIYRKYSNYGSLSIVPTSCSNTFEKCIEDSLNSTWEKFKGFKPGKMIDYSHEQKDWNEAFYQSKAFITLDVSDWEE